MKQLWARVLSSPQAVPLVPLFISAQICNGDDQGKNKYAPINAEWETMAKKVLKGADPAEKLTWRTAEVCADC